MRLSIYQADAFTSKLLGGNPTAIVLLEEWLTSEKMQQITAENNLSETAFFVKKGAKYAVRWFTPALEVALCGHATLAATHVLYTNQK